MKAFLTAKFIMAAIIIAGYPQSALAQNLDKDLLAYYPFNGDASDQTDNNNHGTINGATLTLDRHKRPNNAYSFDGNDSIVVNIRKWSWDSRSSQSISVWVSFDSFGSEYNSIMNTQGDCGDFGHQLTYNKLTRTVNIHTGSACEASVFVESPKPVFNAWYHYVFTYSDGYTSLFVDGKLIGTTNKHNINKPASRELFFSGLGGSAFHGKLDDIRIYNRVLTKDEVKSLYDIETKKPVEAPDSSSTKLYVTNRVVPPGFSMITVPFNFKDNSIGAIFGHTKDIVVYDYNYNHGWTINSYDVDFEEWEIPNHIIPADSAIWVLNNSPKNISLQFKGKPSLKWKGLVSIE